MITSLCSVYIRHAFYFIENISDLSELTELPNTVDTCNPPQVLSVSITLYPITRETRWLPQGVSAPYSLLYEQIEEDLSLLP